jgi:hypothetical protein
LCTRRILAEENEEVLEVEKDRTIKEQFAISMGGGFDEKKMQFFARRMEQKT